MNMTPEEERDALIDRYVNHKLAAEEEAEFEIRMMDDPLLFDDVQIAAALKNGLRQHASLIHAPSPTMAMVRPFSMWIRQPLSLAASVLVAILGVNALVAGRGPQQTGAALGIGTVVLLENMRGSSGLQFTGPPPYLFQIDAGLENQNVVFDVMLHDPATGEVVMRLPELRADADGWVRMVVTQPLKNTFTVTITSRQSESEGPSRIYVLDVEDPADR